MTSPYGYRTLNGKRQLHQGIDYVSKESRQVMAICEGRVLIDVDYYDAKKRWTDKRHSAGNYLVLEHIIHSEKYFVRYIHLDKNFVTKGQKVNQGNVIGTYADAGRSFGAHLHLDMYDKDWNKIDPTPILIKGLNAKFLEDKQNAT